MKTKRRGRRSFGLESFSHLYARTLCVCVAHVTGRKNMKLFYSPASPYVRKVLVLAHEKKIADQIEPINTTANPVKINDVLLAHNPLGKLPCLVLKDGRAIFDSSVITAYIDSLSEPRINPDA